MTLIDRDLKHVWHPCTRMQNLEHYPPVEITKANGAILETPQGNVIDAIGSWWCKPLGHRPQAVIQAIQDQLTQFEHVMTAQTTQTRMVQLCEKLAVLSKLPYSFFASDGSCAVEIALKLTLHARKIQGFDQKNQFLALKQGYHGETFGSLSVSDLGRFKAPYETHCFTSHFIDIPYTSGLSDVLSQDADLAWATLLPQLEALKPTLNALIFEPLIQGSAGMKPYSLDFLNRLLSWAKDNHIYCIADEIMTGLCRTGRWFAMDYTDHRPDIMCLSKGLTAGTLPLSMTLVSQDLFDLFYSDTTQPPFIHSHTHSGNALAVSAAVATLKILEEDAINDQASLLQTALHQAFTSLQTQTQALSNIRGVGGIIAADLKPSPYPDFMQRFQQAALKRGALLRPLGNALYWFPPLNLSKDLLEKLTEITYESIQEVYCQPGYSYRQGPSVRKRLMKKYVCLLLLLLPFTASHAAADFWRCLAEDEAQSMWKVDNAFQKRALNEAYSLCKKQSTTPKSCRVSQSGCQFFKDGVNTTPLWKCTGLDRMSKAFVSNLYPNRDDAVLAARAYCKQKSGIPDSCYVNLLTCKSVQSD